MNLADPHLVPNHVAIIMDGNGRWARARFLPRIMGHKKGVEVLRHCVQWFAQRGVKVLSVFAFSSENWRRPEDEVTGLMSLMSNALLKEVGNLQKQDVRLYFVGDRSRLAPAMQVALSKAEADTRANTKFIFNICFNYSGRWDIVQAAESLRQRDQVITEEALSQNLSLAHVEHPDLLIRTGGEQRISNFMLWQLGYTELFFCEAMWPDFSEQDAVVALDSYRHRQRRFGHTSEQLKNKVD